MGTLVRFNDSFELELSLKEYNTDLQVLTDSSFTIKLLTNYMDQDGDRIGD